MTTLVPYAVWIILIGIGLGVIGILAFGVRNIAQGKARPLTIGVMAVPAVLFGLLYLLMTPAQAAIWLTIILFLLGVLALFSSGIWGLFT